MGDSDDEDFQKVLSKIRKSEGQPQEENSNEVEESEFNLGSKDLEAALAQHDTMEEEDDAEEEESKEPSKGKKKRAAKPAA